MQGFLILLPFLGIFVKGNTEPELIKGELEEDKDQDPTIVSFQSEIQTSSNPPPIPSWISQQSKLPTRENLKAISFRVKGDMRPNDPRGTVFYGLKPNGRPAKGVVTSPQVAIIQAHDGKVNVNIQYRVSQMGAVCQNGVPIPWFSFWGIIDLFETPCKIRFVVFVPFIILQIS